MLVQEITQIVNDKQYKDKYKEKYTSLHTDTFIAKLSRRNIFKSTRQF